MKSKTKKLAITSIFFASLVLASTAYAAADLEVTQVGRNITRGGAYSTTTVANAGTEVILINVDVINMGDAGTSTSTTFTATLPAAIEYVANGTKYFGMACADFVNGCPIADSASGTAFPLDNPYVLGALAAGDDITVQYKVKIVAGTQTAASIAGATVTDGSLSVSGAATVGTPDLPPIITLNGGSTINLFVGQTYTELGATATDETEGNISANIVITGTVNTSIAGTYTRRYNVSDSRGNAAAEKTRQVIVSLDTERPVITLLGESTITLTVGDTYTETGATATDNRDGNISTNIVISGTVSTSTAGAYTVRYNVADAAGNAAEEAVRTIVVNNPPAPATVVVVSSSGGGGGGGGSAPRIAETPKTATTSTPVVPIPTAQVTPKTQVTSEEVFRFTTNLSYGMRGEAVTELQKRITAEGAYYGPITGYFGRLTLDGVKVYQKMKGLAASGFVGESTRNILNASGTTTITAPKEAEKTTSETPAAPTVSEEIVKAELREKIKLLQAQLVNLLEQLAAQLKSRL